MKVESSVDPWPSQRKLPFYHALDNFKYEKAAIASCRRAVTTGCPYLALRMEVVVPSSACHTIPMLAPYVPNPNLK